MQKMVITHPKGLILHLYIPGSVQWPSAEVATLLHQELVMVPFVGRVLGVKPKIFNPYTIYLW